MIIEDITGFLRRVPPFQFLDEGTLLTVANSLAMEFYPRHMVILKQDGPQSEYLRIIKKGGVKISVRSGNGEDMVIDYRGEGDLFGLVSLLSRDERQKTTITAIDDTICYLLKKDTIYRLMETSTSFTEELLNSHFSKYIEKTYREMHSRSMFYGSSDHLLFTTFVGDIATRGVITIIQQATIQEAAQEMSKNRISSIIAVDDAGVPVGIVTDRDLREKVVTPGRSIQDKVKDIMSPALIRADARDHCFEAVLKMIKHNIHHILVVKDGRLTGVLTNHDLMLLQGASPLSFAKDLESQQTVEGLVPVADKINRIVGLLLKEGARASNITKVLTELNDRLVRKVLEIAERKFGPAPVPYCWISYGSDGRKEQTFKTDQDNAIIHADVSGERQAAEVRAYFATFTGFVKTSLLQCGFPPCPAGYMASNPEWCQPLRTWKNYFTNWVSTPTPDALLHVVALYDFRPLFGEKELADQLREAINDRIRDQKVFLGHVANMAVKNVPPIGFFKSFVVEKDEKHRDQLNLKVKGFAPLVDILRLFAMERGISETSTLGRIDALRGVNTIVQEYADDFKHAFEFIMLLRIHHQYDQISRGKSPDNFIDPNTLSNLEKRSLKDAFSLISSVQDMIIERYKSLIF